MTTLAAMVTVLQSEVPAVNSTPTTAQYEQAVKDAVLEFSRRCGLAKWAELNIVSGTPSYSLASDFLSMIVLDSLTGVDGVILSNSGIIPVSADWDEQYTIANKQITFTPTPTYSLTCNYKYKSGWIASTGNYTTLGDVETQIVLIKAKQLASEKIANSAASAGGMKYSLGAVSVDKGAGIESLTQMMYKLHGEFVEACAQYNGAVGMA
jgi:hypothetical protein